MFTASYRRNEGALDPIAPPLNGFYDCSWHLTLFAGLVTAKTERAGYQTPIEIVRLRITGSGRKALRYRSGNSIEQARGPNISAVSGKSVLAITAVIDVALNARNGPVNSRALAKNQRLGPRYLESELQALVREGILKAIRGPHGGYVLAREQRRITAADILRAAGTVNDESEKYPDRR